jgi:hypothetical protein
MSLATASRLLPRASHQEDRRPLAGEGPSHAAPDPTTAAVEDRGLALQELRHVRLPCFVVTDVHEVKRRLSRKLIVVR